MEGVIEESRSVKGAVAEPGQESNVAIRLRGVRKTFGTGEQTVQALRGIDWDVFRGQLTMLIGPSGCGKTTLLSVVAGILDCDRGGVVEVFGSDVARMSGGGKTRFRMDHIGFVFQQYNLLPALTATENAAVPLIIAGMARKRALERAREVLADLGMAKRLHSLPSQLSGGQQQRVAIARALVHEPRLIVCDEPTAALDHETGQAVLLLMRKAAVKPDRAVLIVSHDSRVFHFADRMARMDDGHIVQVRTQEAREHEPHSDDVWVEATRG